MAEGWARHLRGDTIAAYSAGVEPHGLNPLAVKVMAEAGVDISNHSSKHVNELASINFDYVITVCDRARESCPLFTAGAVILHHSFDDPPFLARAAASEAEALPHYRRVRDEIRDYIMTLPQALKVAHTS